MTVLSFHEVDIIHSTTKERRTLQIHQFYPREIALKWPLYGIMRFHNRNGHGIARAAPWSIVPESLKKIHKELKIFGPHPEEPNGQKELP